MVGPDKQAGLASQVNPKAPEAYFLDRDAILLSAFLLSFCLDGRKMI